MLSLIELGPINFVKVKSEIEKRTERKFENLRAVKYRMNMVDGIAYLIKAQVDRATDDEYLHLRIVVPISVLDDEEEKPALTFVLTGKSLNDVLFI